VLWGSATLSTSLQEFGQRQFKRLVRGQQSQTGTGRFTFFPHHPIMLFQSLQIFASHDVGVSENLLL
jgi:hypothetical protein